MRVLFAFLVAIGLAACASEAFEAPLDQNGDAPAKLCAGAAKAGFGKCVLYDAFGDGLERWHAENPAPDDATVNVLNFSADNREGILRLRHCPGIPVPSVTTELRLSGAGSLTIAAEWRSAEVDGAVLRMFLDEEPLEFPTDATNSPPAWIATSVAAIANRPRPLLRLEAESRSSTLCADVWVDWIAVEQ